MRTWIRKQQFEPGPFGFLVNPFFLARRALRAEIAAFAKQCTGDVLDVGCGRMPYRDLFAGQRYVGLEIDTQEMRARAYADCFYDGTTFPFEDDAFNTVLCNQVLEHVFNPREFLAEIARVLRPDGKLLLTVPFVWDEHEQPWDYARYSSFGLRSLIEEAGFELLESRKTLTNPSLLAQLFMGYIYKVTWHRAGLRPLAMALIALTGLFGRAVGALAPDNVDLYLDNVVLARRK